MKLGGETDQQNVIMHNGLFAIFLMTVCNSYISELTIMITEPKCSIFNLGQSQYNFIVEALQIQLLFQRPENNQSVTVVIIKEYRYSDTQHRLDLYTLKQ